MGSTIGRMAKSLRKSRSPARSRLRVGCAECAFVDFGDGNDADGEALAAEAIQGALRSWPTDRGIDEPIGIDQKLTGG